jgi:hypothetical protein
LRSGLPRDLIRIFFADDLHLVEPDAAREMPRAEYYVERLEPLAWALSGRE